MHSKDSLCVGERRAQRGSIDSKVDPMSGLRNWGVSQVIFPRPMWAYQRGGSVYDGMFSTSIPRVFRRALSFSSAAVKILICLAVG